MKDTQIIKNIIKELKELNKDPKNLKDYSRFHKDSKKRISLTTPIVRRLARNYFPKDLKKKEIFLLCEKILESKIREKTTIAFQWMYRLEKVYEASDFIFFEKILKKYVTSWGKCDDFCTHAVGSLIHQYPELLPKVFKWTNSKNRWFKRASAVIFVYHAHRKDKKTLKNVFQTAEKLLLDEDDLVQKGYGWMLKEASNHEQKKVFDFVMKHKTNMPRTALRYAIEKMPKNLKRKAMIK